MLKSDVSPPPRKGLTMNRWAVAGLASSGMRFATASIFAAIGLVLFGFFTYEIFYVLEQVPASVQAPRIGQKAPDFSLPDQTGKQVGLTELLSPGGAVLIFYRGYW